MWMGNIQSLTFLLGIHMQKRAVQRMPVRCTGQVCLIKEASEFIMYHLMHVTNFLFFPCTFHLTGYNGSWSHALPVMAGALVGHGCCADHHLYAHHWWKYISIVASVSLLLISKPNRSRQKAAHLEPGSA